MGIEDLITNANSDLVDQHAQLHKAKQQQRSTSGTFIGYNKRGYPLYDVNGRKMVYLGFYCSEEQLTKYIDVAQSVSGSQMKDAHSGAQMLTEPNANALVHFATDFFCRNIGIASSLKPKDIVGITKMLFKTMPNIMKQ